MILTGARYNNNTSTIFLTLACIFTAAAVCGNLIFQKFFYWDFCGIYTFEVSVGLLAYPITFLTTDIIAECCGKTQAQEVVKAGLIASLCIIPILLLANATSATSWSPVDQSTFNQVFDMYGPAVIASLTATAISQFLDIQLFIYLKTWTKGKHLWLRNNLSTIISQIVDTTVVTSLLFFCHIIPEGYGFELVINSILFKMLCTILYTPACYLGVSLLQKKPRNIESAAH